jgi:CHAT domain-containing protein/tetratricopeptide (TPR) repeat protein
MKIHNCRFITFSLAAGIVFLVVFSPAVSWGMTAGELRVQAQKLEEQNKFSEAALLREQAVEEEARSTGTSKTFLGLTLKSDNLQTVARDLSYACQDYYQAKDYAKGIDCYKRALGVLQEGAVESDIPRCLNSIARGYFGSGKQDEGLKNLVDAIEAARKTGQTRLVADYLNDKGNLLTSFSRYRDAIPAHEEAQKLYQQLGETNAAANMYNNIGRAYQEMGQFDKAIDFYKQAYALHIRNGQDAETAVNLNNIGYVHEERGQYDKALWSYEKALAIHRKYGNEQEIPTILNNIGNVYYAWGLYDKALGYCEEALALSRKRGDEVHIASSSACIGVVYREVGRHDEALKYYEEALALNRKNGRSDDAAATLNNLGSVYLLKGKRDKALSCFEEALAIAKKTGNLQNQSNILANIGQVYFFRNEYEQSKQKFEEALVLFRSLRNDDGASNMLYNIGRVQFASKQYSDAEASLRESVLLKEKLRMTAPGPIRRDYTAKQIAMYQYQTSADIRQNDFSEAVKSIELGKAKYLAEQLAENSSLAPILTGDAIQHSLPDDTAVLVYANTNLRDKVIMAITRRELVGVEVANLDLYDVKWSRLSNEASAGLAQARNVHLVEREQKTSRVVELKPSCSCDAIINYYRTLLIASGRQVRGADIKPRTGKADEEEIRTLARLLYRIFVKPVEQTLRGKKKIVIVTDGALGFIPFETLIDDSDHYFIENYQVTYVQSLGIRDLLQKRRYNGERKPLLAFGGAQYEHREQPPAAGSPQPAPGEISYRGRYAEMGLGAWADLPYTRTEVQSIAAIVPGATTYYGEQASEGTVKDLDRQGVLAQYKVIHFATHGMVVPAYPELSALVLSQGSNAQGEDGYLRMEEIQKLHLKADFVNLSACDTGLGKLYEGEGVVSLAHAFLIAGANSVSVSLWQVADESTAAFMAGVYKYAAAHEGNYAQAITEMKRKFIRGDYGQSNKAPYFWAPFVFYGN